MQAKKVDPGLVGISVRVYRLMVHAYPVTFRGQYGEMMVQVFRDSCLQTSRQNSPVGLLALWLRTLADILLSVIEQYSNRGAVMTKSNMIRLSGWLLAASGLISLLGWMAGSRPEYSPYNAASWPIDRYLKAAVFPLTLMGGLLILVGILGLAARFWQQAGGLGRAGLLTSALGSAAMVVGIVGLSITDSSPWWETIMLGVTVLFVGLGMFGIVCLRRKLFSRWNGLPLAISLPWPVMVILSLGLTPELPDAIIAAMFIVAFGGLALVGYRLQSDTAGLQPV